MGQNISVKCLAARSSTGDRFQAIQNFFSSSLRPGRLWGPPRIQEKFFLRRKSAGAFSLPLITVMFARLSHTISHLVDEYI